MNHIGRILILYPRAVVVNESDLCCFNCEKVALDGEKYCKDCKENEEILDQDIPDTIEWKPTRPESINQGKSNSESRIKCVNCPNLVQKNKTLCKMCRRLEELNHPKLQKKEEIAHRRLSISRLLLFSCAALATYFAYKLISNIGTFFDWYYENGFSDIFLACCFMVPYILFFLLTDTDSKNESIHVFDIIILLIKIIFFPITFVLLLILMLNGKYDTKGPP